MLTSIYELSFLKDISSKLFNKREAKITASIMMDDIKRKMKSEDFKRNKKTIEEKLSELIGGLT